MDNLVYFPLLITMALTTYLVRAIPFTLFRKKITNSRVQAFFEYIPYSVLSAMTFPAILYSTGNVVAAFAGLVTALVLAWKGKSLLIVALGTCLASFLVSLIMLYFPSVI